MRARVGIAVGVVVLCTSGGAARAQSAPDPLAYGSSLGPPRVRWIGAQGDANGAAGAQGAAGSLFEPLRLALFGDAPPVAGAQGVRCDENVEATGTATAATGGFARSYAAAVRLGPRLSLVGFSRGGCALDAAGAVGLVHVMPLRKDVFLATSAGALLAPHQSAGAPITRMQLRTDVVFTRSGGRSFRVGIGTGGRVTGLTFGGLL